MASGAKDRFAQALTKAGLAPDARDRAAAAEIAASLDRAQARLKAFMQDRAADDAD